MLHLADVLHMMCCMALKIECDRCGTQVKATGSGVAPSTWSRVSVAVGNFGPDTKTFCSSCTQAVKRCLAEVPPEAA